MGEMRADRFLSVSGICTRSEAKKVIRAGRLKKNGVPVTKPEVKLDPAKDELFLDGERLCHEEHEYWILNKPAGIISATEDPRHETVISYMGLKRRNMAPCGRLDIDTEGLILVTDDGALVHRLLAPSSHVDKVYEVSYEGTLPEDAAKRTAEGLLLEDGTKCLPAELTDIGNPARIILREGKFHQVRRMFAAAGHEVLELHRFRFGPLNLDGSLLEGEWRELRPEEVQTLYRAAGMEKV